MPKKSSDMYGSMLKMNMLSMLLNIILAIAVVVLVLEIPHIGTTAGSGLVSSPSHNSSVNNTGTSQYSGTTANIDQPLNATELAVINNAPLNYYETAGEMLLNGTLTNQVVLEPPSKVSHFSPYLFDGKPSVIYVGALSCIFCGENRWAMALALGKFGTFNNLYKGYSSFGDGDIPTLYFSAYNYTTPSGAAFGNSYNSSLINLFTADYESPVTAGFEFPSTGIPYFVQHAPNATYRSAMEFMNSTNEFSGTPFSYWGNSIVNGADAVIFGNTSQGATLPIAGMTHAQILQQFRSFNDQFAWSEYAAADVYIAYTCPSVNNTAQVCSLPAIQTLESRLGV